MSELTASMGNTTYTLDEERPTPGMVAIVRRNSDGETIFHVPRQLFETYAVRRIEECARKILAESKGFR